jgi:hypothetical protein
MDTFFLWNKLYDKLSVGLCTQRQSRGSLEMTPYRGIEFLAVLYKTCNTLWVKVHAQMYTEVCQVLVHVLKKLWYEYVFWNRMYAIWIFQTGYWFQYEKYSINKSLNTTVYKTDFFLHISALYEVKLCPWFIYRKAKSSPPRCSSMV